MPPASYLIRLSSMSGCPPMLQVALNLPPDPRETKSVPFDAPEPKPYGPHDASHDCCWSIIAAVTQGDPVLLKVWLDYGVAVDDEIEWLSYRSGQPHGDHVGCLLQRAVEDGLLPMARLLLERGALPNRYIGMYGGGPTTPLIKAIHGGSYAMVRLLMAHGGILDGWCVYAACRNELMAELLLELGADVNCLILHPLPPHRSFGTALHSEASRQDKTEAGVVDERVEYTKWLLEHGIDFTVKDGEGKTAADIAQEKGHLAIKKVIDDWAKEHEAPLTLPPITTSSWSR